MAAIESSISRISYDCTQTHLTDRCVPVLFVIIISNGGHENGNKDDTSMCIGKVEILRNYSVFYQLKNEHDAILQANHFARTSFL